MSERDIAYQKVTKADDGNFFVSLTGRPTCLVAPVDSPQSARLSHCFCYLYTLQLLILWHFQSFFQVVWIKVGLFWWPLLRKKKRHQKAPAYKLRAPKMLLFFHMCVIPLLYLLPYYGGRFSRRGSQILHQNSCTNAAAIFPKKTKTKIKRQKIAGSGSTTLEDDFCCLAPKRWRQRRSIKIKATVT